MIFGRKKIESADSDQGSIINKETEGLSQGQIVRKRFLQHKAAMIAIFVLSSIVIFVFSALKQKIGPWTYPGWWKYGIEDLLFLNLQLQCLYIQIHYGLERKVVPIFQCLYIQMGRQDI